MSEKNKRRRKVPWASWVMFALGVVSAVVTVRAYLVDGVAASWPPAGLTLVCFAAAGMAWRSTP